MSYLRAATLFTLAATAVGCSPAPEGLADAQPARTTVKMDLFHKPLPEIPLPNDLATRYDETSATGRRINASMITPTAMEAGLRRSIDQLDGFGLFGAITIPFTGPIDVSTVLAAHRDPYYDLADDVVYLVNIDRDSARFGELYPLDFGNGNYPAVLESRDVYGKNDPREDLLSLSFEEVSEDANHNGQLDPGEDANGNGTLDPGEDADGDGELDPPEDTDCDNLLDAPNYLPGSQPAWDDLAGRADALMTFYEKQTNTLIARPMMPLDERTSYAVIVTRRIRDAGGEPVGSPYPSINHLTQTEQLRPVLEVLPKGLSVSDIAYVFPFTTQTVQSTWKALRDGLRGSGAQAHLAKEYPAKLAAIEPMRDPAYFPNMTNPHILYGEVWAPAIEKIMVDFGGTAPGEFTKGLVEGTRYIDFMAVGSFDSPQLFPRNDSSGKPLHLNDQVWPPDIDRVAADARPERVHFTLAVPRKEVSARGEGKPVPVAFLIHGYQTNRFEMMQLAGYVAKFGIAVIGIDGPSHGLGLSQVESALAQGLVEELGIKPAVQAIFSDRATDLNGDGVKDSGVDFWTAYLFHTRDMVRQFALDHLHLTRILETFDGQTRWDFDVNGDGQPDLAGDFDGDGYIDIGGDAPLYTFGGSLGGIMSLVLGAIEPKVSAIIPVSGGGGYGDMAIRSHQGGVPQAFMLRSMGPLYVGTLDESGSLALEIIVPDLASEADVPLTTVSGVKAWDTMVVENLDNGVRRCGFVSEAGTVRVGVESDLGDRTRILFYRGPQIVTGPEECQIRSGAELYETIDTFPSALNFQEAYYEADSPLVAIADGLGGRKGHPDFRRLVGLGQMIMDPADPVVLGRHLQQEPLVYSDGKRTGAHVFIATSMGDMGVPASSGLTIGRVLGLIPYLEEDPRYGKPANQEVIDTYTAEAVHLMKRYTDPDGNGVHLDVENFSQGTDMYGTDVPRLDPPLHLGMDRTDPLGGVSTAIFPYNIPEGQHGFEFPGQMTDRYRQECKESCPEGWLCDCNNAKTFDIGWFMLNMFGRYLLKDGKEISTDLCNSSNDCDDIPPPPDVRDVSELP